MSLNRPGAVISDSEVTSIEISGFWLLVENQEYFVPFDDYPSFKQARVEQIFAFERLGISQFYWSDLDIDIELNALEHPELFPLVYKS